LTASLDGYHPIYGISANRDAWWDLEPGRAIGYFPRDDAAELEPPEMGPDDAMEGARVGGPYASATYGRRPFGGEGP
jgi:uronate dehydrogenase